MNATSVSEYYIYIYIYIYIYTSVDLCISMHRILWIRSCRDLAVVLSVMWFVIGVLSLYLFFVSCLVSCLAVTVHRP